MVQSLVAAPPALSRGAPTSRAADCSSLGDTGLRESRGADGQHPHPRGRPQMLAKLKKVADRVATIKATKVASPAVSH
jgi:hypothetical protein